MENNLERFRGGRLRPDWCLLTDHLDGGTADRLAEWTVAAPERTLVFQDHDVPVGTLEAAERQQKLLHFAERHRTVYRYGAGIGYWLAMEEFLRPGDLLVGLGRHVATVGALGAVGLRVTPEELGRALAGEPLDRPAPEVVEISLTGALPAGTAASDLALALLRDHPDWGGKLLALSGGGLTLEERAAVCNLLAGAEPWSVVFREAAEAPCVTVDLGALEPLALLPGDFRRVAPRAAADGLRVSQVFLGGCCGGGLESLRRAAALLKDRKTDPSVRFLVAPATAEVMARAMDEGLTEVLMDAGAVFMNQGCGGCWARSLGRVDRNEVFVSTGSYNCPDWAGRDHPGVWIVPPETAVRCALTGMLYES